MGPTNVTERVLADYQLEVNLLVLEETTVKKSMLGPGGA